jgi:glutathione S-transferase
MSEFIVHGVPGSPYVRGALLGLEEKGASWRLEPLKGPGAGRSAEHLARHPFGKVPVLDHRDSSGGDFRLYETQAILRYLDRLIPAPPLTPTDPRAEARMNQLIGVTDNYVFPHISAGITFGRVVAPRFGMPADEARIAASIPLARVCLAEIGRLLADQTWLAGEALSLADLMLIPHMAFLEEAAEGAELLGPHPNIRAWIARMHERPSMRATTWDTVRALAAA